MLIGVGMKNSLWGEAVITAAYLINRSSSSVIGFKTPQEMWTRKSPSLAHLRPFGCTTYVQSSQGKLQPRALKCVMLGYPEGVKGYKLLLIQPGGYKVITSRSVTFNEKEFYFKTKLMPTVDNSSTQDTAPDIPQGNFYQASEIPHDEEEEFDIGHSSGFQSSATESFEGNIEAWDDEGNIKIQGQQLHQFGGGVSNSNSNSSTELSSDAHTEHDSVPENSVDNVHDLSSYQLTRDREPRIRIPNKRFEMNLLENYDKIVEFAFNVVELVKNFTLETYEQAIGCRQANDWLKAMQEEIQSMHLNNTWSLVPKPAKARLIDCKWIYKLKEGANKTSPPRFKARLVAKGFTQKEGVDYNDIFALVVKYKTMRLMIAMTVVFELEMEQMDVKTTFLHGDLHETIYMKQPKGFVDKSKPDHACLLKKSIYGLKQSPRQWNKNFDACMTSLGFTRSSYDTCLYFKNIKSTTPMYIMLYVDDILLISNSKVVIAGVKHDLKKHFDMKDLGVAKKILGVTIIRNRAKKTIYLSQSDYLQKVLDMFAMKDTKVAHIPLGGHLELTKRD